MNNRYSSLIIGEIALDTNVDYDGTVTEAVGGAVYYAGYAAARMGHPTAVLPKAHLTPGELRTAFAGAPGAEVFPLRSPRSTVIRNEYHTPDRERRTSTVSSVIPPYRPEEIPPVDAAVWHLAGLVRGDIPDELIPWAAARGRVALDVQCMLRCVEDGTMVYRDWAAKRELLPYVRFLKTDAAEAEILTGTEDRAEAARLLHSWGAEEVMITHSTEILVYGGGEIHTCPLRARNLSGRTGRGDTAFAGYLGERLTRGIPEALRTAAALVSLKMETPGPFRGSREDVEACLRERYGGGTA